MSNKLMLSNLGFFLGIIGIIFASIPFFSKGSIQFYNTILPILLGIIGLILVFKVKKELNDDIVKAGLVLNLLAIFFAIIQIVIYLIK
ncbi:MAG: hypothetical protein WC979_09850 [Candidatus Pacearchaeota archaeon]